MTKLEIIQQVPFVTLFGGHVLQIMQHILGIVEHKVPIDFHPVPTAPSTVVIDTLDIQPRHTMLQPMTENIRCRLPGPVCNVRIEQIETYFLARCSRRNKSEFHTDSKDQVFFIVRPRHLVQVDRAYHEFMHEIRVLDLYKVGRELQSTEGAGHVEIAIVSLNL